MSAEQDDARPVFQPSSDMAEGLRIQVLVSGKWITVFDVPSRHTNEQGESCEMFYWLQMCKNIDRAMQLDRMLRAPNKGCTDAQRQTS